MVNGTTGLLVVMPVGLLVDEIGPARIVNAHRGLYIKNHLEVSCPRINLRCLFPIEYSASSLGFSGWVSGSLFNTSLFLEVDLSKCYLEVGSSDCLIFRTVTSNDTKNGKGEKGFCIEVHTNS